MYDWKDDYVVRGTLKDGWYYIRTWADMEKEFGLFLRHINISPGFNPLMEETLPPCRCIQVIKGKWVGSEAFRGRGEHPFNISPDMVASPAFTIGKKYEFSDSGGGIWTKAKYSGFDFDREYKHRCMEADFFTGYHYCREIKEEKEEIKITRNGKEIILTDEQIKLLGL